MGRAGSELDVAVSLRNAVHDVGEITPPFRRTSLRHVQGELAGPRIAPQRVGGWRQDSVPWKALSVRLAGLPKP